MKQCGQCGTQNLDQQTVCTGCSSQLPPAVPSFGGTLLIEPPPPPPPPPEAPETPEQLGPAPPPRANLRGTMIGLAPPTFAAPGGSAPTESASPTLTPGQATPASPNRPARTFGATMIGMAPPEVAYPSPPPAPPVPPVGAVDPASTAAGGTPRLASAQKTVLGVARPGIAPLNPGQPKSNPPPPTPAAPLPVAAPAPWLQPPASSTAGPVSPRRQRADRISLGATVAIVGAAMLLVMAVVAFFMLRGHGSVTARAGLDGNGNEVLDLTCRECPDGTKVWIDSAPVAFLAGKAALKLQAPLQVGENPIVLVLERPGRSREEIALSLPIEYRVRSSTDALTQDPPKLSVLARVRAGGTKLEIDGKPVTPDAQGEARFDYDVTADVTGPEPSVKLLDRRVPYKATSENGDAQSGQVQIRIGVTPLIVDAPGPRIVVGEKELVIAGRTAPGAALRVGAQPVTLDPEGRFVSKQPLVVGDNSFIVRATLKDHAPRLINVQARRSDDLQRDAALARSMAQISYPEVMRAQDAALGQNLALTGQLFDARHDGYCSVLLLDVKNGCKNGPCLAKVIYGVETALEKGRSIQAFGKLQRFVDGPRTGERIPEVRAELVVVGAP